MGEILLEWARNIIFFMVFLSVISHLLADASYEKYIRFFAGIVLILITVSPLKGGLDFQEKAGRAVMQLFLGFDGGPSGDQQPIAAVNHHVPFQTQGFQRDQTFANQGGVLWHGGTSFY